jgi:ribosomal-protein-alanine N-acetyltransferase
VAFAVTGPTLTLRLPEPADAPALFALGSDPDVTRYFSWGPYREQAEAEAWLATLPGKRERGESLELAMIHRERGFAGIILLTEPSPRDRRIIVGTWFGRAFWRTGANEEAKALVARLAFDRLGIERLGSYADVRNERSQTALERLGWVREGVLRRFHRHGDEPRDVVSYSLLREEWIASRLYSVPAAIEGEVPAGWAQRRPPEDGRET